MSHHSTNQSIGFTLIEVSIVLVIIALIVGGVLVGKDLIEAATIRSYIKQKEEYHTAVNTFRLKYNGIPGDLRNATDFFGVLSTCPTERNTYGTTLTCNGNGDSYVSRTFNVPELYEQWRFWQHLGSAGFISGSYTGKCSACNTATVGEDIPDAGVGKDNGWMVGSAANWYSATVLSSVSGSSDGMIYLGGAINAYPAANLSVFQIYQIDRKADDGYPLTGAVITGQNPAWYSPGCWQTVATVTSYVLTSTTKTCPLIFLNIF